MSSNLTPLTLNATLFTLLLVWNLIFSRIFLGEHAGAPRTFGAVLIVIGAAISVLGTPTTARNQFGVNDIGNLVKTVIGAIYLILQIGSGLIAASAVVWFERTYTLGEQEQEVRRDRTKSLAYNVIFDGKASIALGEHPSFTNTPAQTRWQTSGRKLIEKLQNTVKALTAIWFSCKEKEWPSCCLASGWTWAFFVVFCSIGMLTVIWLRIVYTRFETTTGLPIEYGTVQLCSVLGGLLLYQEYTFLDPHQMVLITVGLSIVLLGVAFSSRKTMPECLVGVFDQSVRAVSSIISTKAASDGRGWDDGSGGLAQRTNRRKSLWQWASMKRINKREMVIDAPLAE